MWSDLEPASGDGHCTCPPQPPGLPRPRGGHKTCAQHALALVLSGRPREARRGLWAPGQRDWRDIGGEAPGGGGVSDLPGGGRAGRRMESRGCGSLGGPPGRVAPRGCSGHSRAGSRQGRVWGSWGGLEHLNRWGEVVSGDQRAPGGPAEADLAWQVLRRPGRVSGLLPVDQPSWPHPKSPLARNPRGGCPARTSATWAWWRPSPAFPAALGRPTAPADPAPASLRGTPPGVHSATKCF